MLEVGESLSEGAKENGEGTENDFHEEESQRLGSDVEMLSTRLTGLMDIEFDESPYKFINRKWKSYNPYDCFDITSVKEKEDSKHNEGKTDVNLEDIENQEIVRQTSLYFGLNLVT